MKKFDALTESEQQEIVIEFCQECDADYLYPYFSLAELLDAWGCDPEEAFRAGFNNNFDMDPDDEIFIGDACNDSVMSFENWSMYMAYFMEHEGRPFREFLEDLHPELVEEEE